MRATTRRLLATALLLSLPVGSIAAQQGTAVWQMRMQLPDSIAAQTGGMSTIDMRFTAAADGDLAGFQVDFGPEMNVTGPMPIDLSQIRIQAVMNAATDSVAIGIVLPPEIAAMAGGGIGFRLDFAMPTPDAIGAMIPDSLLDQMRTAAEKDESGAENTGVTSVVAGITCEEWIFTPPPSGDQDQVIRMCLAESPPAMKAFSDIFNRMVPEAQNPLAEFRKMGQERFGGRDMTAMRTTMTGTLNMTVELLSLSNDSPGPSFFALPIDLQPFPIEMFQGMAAAALQQGT
jgi:hypothetical protein